MDVIAPTDNPGPAIPVDAISAILAAFEKHEVVALDEGDHTNEQGHAFRLSLIRDPRFSDVVNDIVVEFGSARYQDIMDRFVSGEDVPDTELRQVWQNTTSAYGVWDVPIYEEFFRAVREFNSSLPKERQLRVLLGDPPVDWDNSHPEYFDKLLYSRDSHPAELIEKEVLAKKRRALIIYGGNHFLRKELVFTDINDDNFSTTDGDLSLVARLESQAKIKVFTIWTYTFGEDIGMLQPDIQSWHQPSLTKLRATILGEQDYGFYFPGPMMNKMIDGKLRFFKFRPGQRMEEQFDALLYLGPTSTITYSELPVEFCSDLAYIEMRKRRTALAGDLNWTERFKKFCDEKKGIKVKDV